jgi:hypothetical protein
LLSLQLHLQQFLPGASAHQRDTLRRLACDRLAVIGRAAGVEVLLCPELERGSDRDQLQAAAPGAEGPGGSGDDSAPIGVLAVVRASGGGGGGGGARAGSPPPAAAPVPCGGVGNAMEGTGTTDEVGC